MAEATGSFKDDLDHVAWLAESTKDAAKANSFTVTNSFTVFFLDKSPF